MIFTPDNLDTCLAATPAVYDEWHDKLSAKGFRMHSLSLAGTPSAPRYTAVMVKGEAVFAGHSSPKLTRAALDAKITAMADQTPPFHPYILTACGPRAEAIYAVAFRKAAEAPIVKPDLSVEELNVENATQRAAGKIPVWIDAYGTPGDTRYCAIWAVNDARLAWNAEAVADSGDKLQQRFDAMVSVGARPALAALTPGGTLAGVYVDSRLKQKWSMFAKQSMAGLKETMKSERDLGRFPVRIGTATVGGEVRFAAIFAGGDEIVPRKFRKQGPPPIGLSPADQIKADGIDDWMEGYLTNNNFRGAAVAVVVGKRLVYAKGYNFSEPAALYDDILPTTLFRMGSVSKTFCAVAVWKALADSPTFSRDSRIKQFLGLPKKLAVPADFETVTVRHLLESNSGIAQGGVRGTVARIKKEEGPQPLTSPQIAEIVAAEPMAGAPGALLPNGKRDTKYGSTDYFLLGFVAAKIAEVVGFEAALKKLVLDPLGMKRTRGSTTKAEDRKADEAMHHLPALDTAKSAVHSDRRLVPVQYGDENYEIYDGAGGVSASVVDVARLGAMLSCRVGNPIFSTATLDAMLADAVAATSQGNDKGYHGFDGASLQGPGGTMVGFSKGGTNPGVGAGISGATGGITVVITRNGPNAPGLTNTWMAAIGGIASTINWGTGDLFPFPGFDMASL